MTFLYFLPGHMAGIDPAGLAQAGLSYALEGAQLSVAQVMKGPGNQAGSLVADGRYADAGKVLYDPDGQTWRQIPNTKVLVGYYNTDPPAPGDLERSSMLPGHAVELGDGRRWLVPVARGLAEDGSGGIKWYHTLPLATDLDQAGNWTQSQVVPRYRPLWEIALRYFDAVRDAATDRSDGSDRRLEFDFAGLQDAALAALATNYRVGRAEVAALGLFTSDTVPAILNALIDGPTLAGWLEKKARGSGAGGSATGPGPAAEPPTTPRP